MFPLHVYPGCLYACFPCLNKCCGSAVGGQEIKIEVKLKIFRRLFPSPAYSAIANDMHLHALSQRLVDSLTNSDCSAVIVPEGCFCFIKFFEIRTRGPGAPQGSRGTLRVRRNLANTPGVPQVPLRPFAAVLACCCDPGASQVPHGSFGSLEIFIILAVDRGTPKGSRTPAGALGTVNLAFDVDPGGPRGAPGAPGGVLSRRSSWLAHVGELVETVRNNCERLTIGVGVSSSCSIVAVDNLGALGPWFRDLTVFHFGDCSIGISIVLFYTVELQRNSLKDMGPRFGDPLVIHHRDADVCGRALPM